MKAQIPWLRVFIESVVIVGSILLAFGRRLRLSAARPAMWCAVAVLLTGCATWRPAEVGPEATMAERSPSSIRVILEDGGQLTLSEPEIQGDTLRGVSEDTRVGIALADIVSLETKHYRVLGIIGAILITPAVAVGMVLMAFAIS